MSRSNPFGRMLAVLGLIALAACGEVPRPFEDENKAISPSPLLVPKADAGMVVVPVRGAPNRASIELADLIAEAAESRVVRVPESPPGTSAVPASAARSARSSLAACSPSTVK